VNAAYRTLSQQYGEKGGDAVVNDVDVRLPTAHERTDARLAEAVVEALEQDVLVPHGRIRPRVSDGRVRLEGDVEWHLPADSRRRGSPRWTTGCRWGRESGCGGTG
jgi:osmotically-inducible protein OsmY